MSSPAQSAPLIKSVPHTPIGLFAVMSKHMVGSMCRVSCMRTSRAGRVAELHRLVSGCEASAAMPIDTESGPVGITATIGTAVGRGGESSLDELLRNADAALAVRRSELS